MVTGRGALCSQGGGIHGHRQRDSSPTVRVHGQHLQKGGGVGGGVGLRRSTSAQHASRNVICLRHKSNPFGLLTYRTHLFAASLAAR